MRDRPSVSPYYGGGVYRAVWGVFGLFLACLGVVVVLFGVVDLPIRIGAGLLMILLGADAMWSAIQSRQSWLAKFVPFI